MIRNVPSPNFKIDNGSSIAVIGGGPAGSFFSYFCLDIASRLDYKLDIDVYEPADFSKKGPLGCNHCGGIVSESLVQILSTEGINLPSNVVRRCIDSYVMHIDDRSIRMTTPLAEKRIAAIYRGSGPLHSTDLVWKSFDNFLQKLTKEKGVQIINDSVISINTDESSCTVNTKKGGSKNYDLIVGAVGLHPQSLNLFKTIAPNYTPPKVTKAFICEFHLGKNEVKNYFGNSMHIFLLNLKNLKFAALIPKGDYVTLALLGNNVNKELVIKFMNSPEVKKCFPKNKKLVDCYPCFCFPKINVLGAKHPFWDRVVLIGDCSVSKLYKNGIGAAYITAKAAATTAVLQGISANDFKKHYLPICKSLSRDNRLGKFIFKVASIIQKQPILKRGIFRLVAKEQQKEGEKRHMSAALWDLFTGSATYLNVFWRLLNPASWIKQIKETILGLLYPNKEIIIKENLVKSKELGKIYQDGDIIIKQGEVGNCLYVIQSGYVKIFQEDEKKETFIAQLGENDFFGEMALFEKDVRSSTVKSSGASRILTVDKKTLLSTIQKDPSLAFRMLGKMSHRIRKLNKELSRLK